MRLSMLVSCFDPVKWCIDMARLICLGVFTLPCDTQWMIFCPSMMKCHSSAEFPFSCVIVEGMSLVWLNGEGGGFGSLGSCVRARLTAELASGGLTQPVILPKVSKMSTSILVIIPAGSKATKGLASGRASSRKKTLRQERVP